MSRPTSPIPITSNMLTTCRNLQSFLTVDPSSAPTAAPPRLLSPIHFAPPKRTTAHRTKVAKAQPPAPMQKGINKRRRAVEDEGEREETKRAKPTTPLTPEGQSACPLELPLGLQQADFDALASSQSPPRASPRPTHDFTFRVPARSRPEPLEQPLTFPPTSHPAPQSHHTSPHREPHPPTSSPNPSPTPSEEALIALVLTKLHIKRADWDDCARRLGQGKDSIGERWKLLLGDGDEGAMRRGGRRSRPEVCGEWR